MGFVFNRKELYFACKDYGIEPKFNSSAEVDETLGKLAMKACSHYSWVGSGIARNGFDIGNYFIKISNAFYADEDDMGAIERFYSNRDLYGEDDDEEYEPFNRIDEAWDAGCVEEQSLTEIYNYIMACATGISDKFAKIYAATSNGNIMLVEKCDGGYNGDCEALDWLETHFEDIHCENVGTNGIGDLVCLDAGFIFDWKELIGNLDLKPCYELNRKLRKELLFLHD